MAQSVCSVFLDTYKIRVYSALQNSKKNKAYV